MKYIKHTPIREQGIETRKWGQLSLQVTSVYRRSYVVFRQHQNAATILIRNHILTSNYNLRFGGHSPPEANKLTYIS